MNKFGTLLLTLTASTVALADESKFDFACKCYDVGAATCEITEPFALTVENSVPTIQTQDDIYYNGVYDPTYRPRYNLDFKRFRGSAFSELFETSGGWYEYSGVLIENKILSGKSGRVKVQYTGHDAHTDLYLCTAE